MLFSERHEFLFVHIPKTAGTALRRSLEPYSTINSRAGWSKQLSRLPIRQSVQDVSFRMHVSARWAKIKLPLAAYDRWCKFTVVRNPFDRAVSHYHWQSQAPGQRHYKRSQAMSFKDHLRDMQRRQRWHDERQVRYICDRDGKLLVDRVLRFENLPAEFDALARDLGLDATLAVHNKSLHRPYADYYDEEARQMVIALFRDDFDLLGYSTSIDPTP